MLSTEWIFPLMEVIKCCTKDTDVTTIANIFSTSNHKSQLKASQLIAYFHFISYNMFSPSIICH